MCEGSVRRRYGVPLCASARNESNAAYGRLRRNSVLRPTQPAETYDPNMDILYRYDDHFAHHPDRVLEAALNATRKQKRLPRTRTYTVSDRPLAFETRLLSASACSSLVLSCSSERLVPAPHYPLHMSKDGRLPLRRGSSPPLPSSRLLSHP